MSVASPAPAATLARDRPAGWPTLLALGLGLAGLALLFRAEAAAALRVWRDSTAYSHCFLVLPIALWLAWDRRAAARGLPLRPTPWPLLAIPVLGLGWFTAERLGLMEGRQLAALLMAQALLVALLGWRLARVQAPALAYLLFLVPVGGFLVPGLQHVTAGFVDVGLEMLGIPHVVDEFSIEIPEGMFYVAEACAGLRFLIAALAFGALYGVLCFRDPGRRLLFLVACLVVPILANGVRALGIVLAGHLLGSAEAAAADHLIYGWGFFSAIIFLLALAGLPFRQDARPPAAAAAMPLVPAGRPGAALAIAGMACVLAAAGPAASLLLNRPGAMPAPHLPGFVATGSCRALDAGDPAWTWHFGCNGAALSARVEFLPPHAPPALLRARRLAATERAASGDDAPADTITGQLDLAAGDAGITEIDPRVPPRWSLVESDEPARLTATATWIGGAPAPSGWSGRLRLAWDGLRGAGTPAALVVVTLAPPAPALDADWGPASRRDAPRRLLADFLRAQGEQFAAIAQATVGTETK